MHRKLHGRISPSTLRKRRTVVALALGFTAVPAVALAATDAVPGDPFKLGQDNRIVNQSTTLAGIGQKNDGLLQLRKAGGANAGAGAVLKVVNEGQGISRGIDISVAPGQRPISVNPDAGKASGLNADKLDGKDSEDFLPSRLYGNTSGVIEGHGNETSVFLVVACDNGDIALNAGNTAAPGHEDDLNDIMPFRSSYNFEYQDNGDPSKFRANIMCIDSAAPFRPVE